MLEISAKNDSLNRVKEMMISIGANVRKELAVAVNNTVGDAKKASAKELGKIFPVPNKTLKKLVGQKRRANERRVEAVMALREGYPFPLKFFKPKQGASGVTVRMDKRIKGKKGETLYKGAFQGPRPGVMKRTWKGNVFARQGEKRRMTKGRYAGQMRQPIVKLFGPSPAQAIQDTQLDKLIVAVAGKQLSVQVAERLRFLILKSQGKLRGKQK